MLQPLQVRHIENCESFKRLTVYVSKQLNRLPILPWQIFNFFKFFFVPHLQLPPTLARHHLCFGSTHPPVDLR